MPWTMTQREVKFYEFKCDRPGCPTEAIVSRKLPAHWVSGTREVHNCGSTGYTRTDYLHYCGSCVANGQVPADVQAD